MDASFWVALAVGIVVITSAMLGGLLWLIRGQIAQAKEMKANGGATLRDSADRSEEQARANGELLSTMVEAAAEFRKEVCDAIQRIHEEQKSSTEEVHRGFAETRRDINGLGTRITKQGDDIHAAVSGVHTRVNEHLDFHLKESVR